MSSLEGVLAAFNDGHISIDSAIPQLEKLLGRPLEVGQMHVLRERDRAGHIPYGKLLGCFRAAPVRRNPSRRECTPYVVPSVRQHVRSNNPNPLVQPQMKQSISKPRGRRAGTFSQLPTQQNHPDMLRWNAGSQQRNSAKNGASEQQRAQSVSRKQFPYSADHLKGSGALINTALVAPEVKKPARKLSPSHHLHRGYAHGQSLSPTRLWDHTGRAVYRKGNPRMTESSLGSDLRPRPSKDANKQPQRDGGVTITPNGVQGGTRGASDTQPPPVNLVARDREISRFSRLLAGGRVSSVNCMEQHNIRAAGWQR